MGLLDTVRNPAFRMGLRRSAQIWRHNIPPYATIGYGGDSSTCRISLARSTVTAIGSRRTS